MYVDVLFLIFHVDFLQSADTHYFALSAKIIGEKNVNSHGAVE